MRFRDRHSDCRTGGRQCFFPAWHSKPRLGFAMVERRKVQTCRKPGGLRLRERRVCVEHCVLLESTVLGALLIRVCWAGRLAPGRASIQAAISDDAERVLL